MTAAGRALACAAVALAATGSRRRPQLPSFRAGVDLVSLSVTVTDASGRYVTDLTPDQLQRLRGRRRSRTSRTSIGRTCRSRCRSCSTRARAWRTRWRPPGRRRSASPVASGRRTSAQLIGFADRVEVLQSFTSDQAALERAIRKTAANGSTALRNAVYIALKELKKVRATTEQDIRRQAIVVFTDGEDTSSLVGLRRTARPGQAVRDGHLRHRPAVALRDRRPDLRGHRLLLRQLAQQTGGRVFFPARIEDLAGRLRADRRRAGQPVRRRVRLEEHQARRRVAEADRPRGSGEDDGARQAGVLRAQIGRDGSRLSALDSGLSRASAASRRGTCAGW